jgi:hypothetical protein
MFGDGEEPARASGGKLGAVFERFTDRGRRVLVLAQEEARLLDHPFIGTEHLLLGLLHEGDGLAAKSLTSLGVSLDAARRAVGERTRPLPSGARGSPPLTPEAKQLLELSLREALQLGHNGIDTEHLLLGLARQGESGAFQVLASLGVDLDQVRRTLLSFMSEPGYVPSDEGAIAGDASRAHRNDLRRARLDPPRRRAVVASQAPPGDLDSDSGAHDGPPAMRTPPPEVPATIASELASRYGPLPVQRIRRHADLWALRRIEKEHVDRLVRDHQLDDVTRDATMSWWIEEVQRRCRGTSARLQREERRRLQRIHRHPRFRSNAVSQLYWNSVGPGGRTWFGNRYATVRRYTFRIHWRP